MMVGRGQRCIEPQLLMALPDTFSISWASITHTHTHTHTHTPHIHTYTHTHTHHTPHTITHSLTHRHTDTYTFLLFACGDTNPDGTHNFFPVVIHSHM